MIALTIALLALGLLLALAVGWIRQQTSRARLDDWLGDDRHADPDLPHERRGLSRWLGLAGYWSTVRVPLFVTAQIAAIGLGLIAVWLLHASGILDVLIGSVSNIPGGVGEAFAAVLSIGAWIVFLAIALAPVFRVRAARRRLVRQVEADLPLVLEIFATLAEAGLGFDASLIRLLDATPGDRPLHRAFQHFRRDVQSGTPRVQALRQLGARLDVPSVTAFVSAIVHAEQVGAGIAGTLRHQADDVRDRRRERVTMLGQLLPVKLMFPLIACFLPGIFLTTLGPALLQMVEVAGGFLR